ncbi:MAG: class I SAM-dependent methyltransferase [Peptococcaceae bacterium]|nr:class I SAM-dependent methyltransferase [Peptococcaceae bacterium]
MDCPKMIIRYALTHDEPALRARLEWYAEQEGIVLTEAMCDESCSFPLLKISRKRTRVLWQGEEIFFHPSMALLRMLSVLRGEPDRFLQAAGLENGNTCIDATMGLAADTLMAAWRVGEAGRVTALEASPLIAALVKEGLREMAASVPSGVRGLKAEAWKHLIQAAGRIDVLLGDHLDFLRAQGDACQDLVYFDPMFRHTRGQSAALRSFKPWMCHEGLREEAVREACRVARRVVLKERTGSREFERFGFAMEPGGRHSPVAFGVRIKKELIPYVFPESR